MSRRNLAELFSMAGSLVGALIGFQLRQVVYFFGRLDLAKHLPWVKIMCIRYSKMIGMSCCGDALSNQESSYMSDLSWATYAVFCFGLMAYMLYEPA